MNHIVIDTKTKSHQFYPPTRPVGSVLSRIFIAKTESHELFAHVNTHELIKDELVCLLISKLKSHTTKEDKEEQQPCMHFISESLVLGESWKEKAL